MPQIPFLHFARKDYTGAGTFLQEGRKKRHGLKITAEESKISEQMT
jgi:hypothetical protein